MMKSQKRVLITCVGSGVGQSAVDSLRLRKADYFLVGSDRNRYSYSVPDCDDFLLLPAIDDPRYVDALVEACRSRRIDALIPGHDMELALVARHRERFEGIGTQPIVADGHLVELLRDKRAWSLQFSRLTTRVVQAWSPIEFRQAVGRGEVQLPAIAKPTAGSASSGLRILHSVADADGLGSDYVIQPFLFPQASDPEAPAIRAAVQAGRILQASEVSVQLAYSRDGSLLGRFASRNRLKSGVPVEFHPLDDPGLWSAVDEVQSVLEEYAPRGPINLQGRITDEGPKFFEMNPRFTGITGNRALFGFNEVALLVDNFTTGERRPLPVNHRKVGLRQVACRTWPVERFRFSHDPEERGGPMTIVVLGATSWLARHFISARARAGDKIVAVIRGSGRTDAAGMFGASHGVQVLELDSRELPDCMAAADVVVNCLSGRPPHGTAAIVDAHRHQMRLLELAEAGEAPLLVNVSSQSVYGNGTDRSESGSLDAVDAYAFSKIAIEECVRGVARRKPSTAAVSLRLARLFGPAAGLRASEFPHRVVVSALQDVAVEVTRPDDVLDLIDIRDAVRALEFFVGRRNPEWRGDAVNVGSGRAVTAGEFASMVDRTSRERLARPLRLTMGGVRVASRPPLDCARIHQAGWSPALSIEQSVSDLFGYLGDAS